MIPGELLANQQHGLHRRIHRRQAPPSRRSRGFIRNASPGAPRPSPPTSGRWQRPSACSAYLRRVLLFPSLLSCRPHRLEALIDLFAKELSASRAQVLRAVRRQAILLMKNPAGLAAVPAPAPASSVCRASGSSGSPSPIRVSSMKASRGSPGSSTWAPGF